MVFLLLPLILLVSTIICDNSVDEKYRINCQPGRDKDPNNCTKLGCILDTSNNTNIPLCYFPAETGYIASNLSNNNSATDKQIILQKDSNSVKNPFGTDFSQLNFTCRRYRPPISIADSTTINSSEKLTIVSTQNKIWSFSVIRNSTGAKIWDTSLGGLLFADQYIQISTIVPTDRIYGFGENIHPSLKHDFSQFRTYAMFARDEAPDSKNPLVNNVGKNLYGVHNFYIGFEGDGKAHGVFFFNSNAQEVTIGGNAITYRTIGGQIEVFFFPGPTPEEVVKQYQQLIGTPILPPYWALGFQLCRYGYQNVSEIRDVVERMKAAGIPQDVQFSDIDYLNQYEDFSYNNDSFADLPQFAKDLHNNYSMHLTLIFDPAIEVDYAPMNRAINADAKFIQWPRADLVPTDTQNRYPLIKNTSIMLGKVWPVRNVAFPDFLDTEPKTNNWWINEFMLFHNQVEFDGAWIDMNEPSNFGTKFRNSTTSTEKDDNAPDLECPKVGNDSKWDLPPYETQASFFYGNDGHLEGKTLCMIGKWGRNKYYLYDSKSLYGWAESFATHKAIRNATGKRGISISRSTFPSSGKYAGHWLGDNTARWEDLRSSVIGAQEFNIFGIPYVGSDICGFGQNTTEELCLRWQQMGAFHSFSRNHNDKNMAPQDPTRWTTVAAAAKKANLFRYRHLPYLYSLHFKASLFGGTVVRPLFFEFPADDFVHQISYQFLWGSSMLIIPVLESNKTTVDGYLPSTATWYSLYDDGYGQKVPNGNSTFTAPWDSLIPVFLRAGSILPRQTPAQTTVLARKNRFEVVIGLNNDAVNGHSIANGELYWDDGDSIPPADLSMHNFYSFIFSFDATSQNATFIITKTKTATNLSLPAVENIEIFGYQWTPDFSTATLNGNSTDITTLSTYNSTSQILNITASGLINLNNGGPTWTFVLANNQPIQTTTHTNGGGGAEKTFTILLGFFILFFVIVLN
uniref:P-type domain-containing protein n=1 Tax=Panagrolaimus davidi TaxID=227884 RepID=A0A914Q7A3_9BILA